ncbi:MAG: fasciclin domain-containing protein [Oryzihumus sp.]
MKIRRTGALAGLALALPLGLAACGNSGTDAASSSSSSTSSDSMTSSPSDTMSSSSSSDASAMVFGASCAAVPKDGKGSFNGMATDPVATAASNNPLLSTLVTAVKKAGLVDTLNSAQGITVFAPTNDAFGKLDKATLNKALSDPKGLLTKVLTNHVVAGKLTPEQLAGTHKTLGGGSISVAGSGESFTVDGNAKVICGNVPTANATVYIIDNVLVPKA